MVERQPSKLHTTVRSRSPAPNFCRGKAVRWLKNHRVSSGAFGRGKCKLSDCDVYEFVHEEARNAVSSRENQAAGSCSSVVEHSLGKGEVVRSIRIKSTKNKHAKKWKPAFSRPS